jgi:hypothetical protein
MRGGWPWPAIDAPPTSPTPGTAPDAHHRLPDEEQGMTDRAFDTITRRAALLPLAVTGLAGFAVLTLPGLGGAKQRKRKAKTRKITRNTYGCVNVGGICKHDRQCCAGICKGNKGKRTCKAHDPWGCAAGLDACLGPDQECLIAGREDGICATTTGNAGYCANWAQCVACPQDADGRPFCGPSAACVHCAGCPASGGMACAGTGDCAIPP